MDCRERIAEVSDWINQQNVDLVLFFDRDNIRYFTGFRLNRAANSILAVKRDGHLTYVVAQLDLERAKRNCWVEDIVPFPEDTPNYLSALRPLFGNKVRRVAVELDVLTVEQARQLQKLALHAFEFVDIRPLTTQLRLIKTVEELDCLRQAAVIADRVMQKLLPELRVGVTETEIVGLAEYYLRAEGAEGAAFEPFIMSGENAWLPQRVCSRKALRPGELAILDLGAQYEGYCSDLTRTVAVGELSADQRRLFRIVRLAQQAALEAIRPGVAALEVDRAAREPIEAEGLGNYFPHLTGHGVGVSIHEAPILDRGVDTVLQPRMVMTVEPGLYVPGVGGARVEDMVVVTPSGYEVLTNAPRELV